MHGRLWSETFEQTDLMQCNSASESHDNQGQDRPAVGGKFVHFPSRATFCCTKSFSGLGFCFFRVLEVLTCSLIVLVSGLDGVSDKASSEKSCKNICISLFFIVANAGHRPDPRIDDFVVFQSRLYPFGRLITSRRSEPQALAGCPCWS